MVGFPELDALRAPSNNVVDKDIALIAAGVHDLWEVASLVGVKTVPLAMINQGRADGKGEVRERCEVKGKNQTVLKKESVLDCTEYQLGSDAPLHSKSTGTLVLPVNRGHEGRETHFLRV